MSVRSEDKNFLDVDKKANMFFAGKDTKTQMSYKEKGAKTSLYFLELVGNHTHDASDFLMENRI